jgi:coenzyme F420-dependent glucose-6-phosphate dehydrogenase
VELGYAFSSEEHGPLDLVAHARSAEEAGFSFGLISDHYHPWIPRQGHSPFVWSVIGGIAQATERFRLGTGVTCPLIRIHPAVVAQAAATSAAMMPGRFFLGVGTGENLNEHVHGDRWPAADERLEMLEEAVEVMRELWKGGYQTHRGKHYTVEHTRIFDLPDAQIEVAVAAMKPRATEVAGRIGDAFVNVAPDAELVKTFDDAGQPGRPKYGQVTCCWAESAEQAKQTAWEIWPNAAIEGAASQELPYPEHFEQLAQVATADDLAESLPLGPDPKPYLEKVEAFEAAGFTHVYFHQIGPDQQGFLDFAKRELLRGRTDK